MSIITSIIFTMFAGLMNGSYAFPVRYMNKWDNDNIWLVFSLAAFFLIPWVWLILENHFVFHFLIEMPCKIIWILLSAGFLFGIGMIVFTYSLRFVGIGVAFALNISSSTILATLLSIILMEPGKLFSEFGIAELTALILFCMAMLTLCLASLYKPENQISMKNKANSKRRALLGVVWGILSGLFTSTQGFAYAYATTNLKQQMSVFPSALLMDAPWILIFNAAFIPYFSHFLFKCAKKKLLNRLFSPGCSNYFFLCTLMAILYFGSLIVFGAASLSFGHMGVAVAWPMFMIFITLASNLWSFIHQEWRGATYSSLVYLSISLFLLVAAIIFLSIASSLAA